MRDTEGVETLSLDCDLGLPGFRLRGGLRLPMEGVGALFGPSGSGKTTLLRVLAGLEQGNRGRLALGDTVWQDASAGTFVPPHRRGIGFVFQDALLFPHLSVRSNLVYGFRRRRGDGRTADPAQVIDLLDLGSLLDRRPWRLSGGERQRVALGRAVLSAPRLLLLDEPLASLDAARREEILPFIESLARELRIPMLYVTHAIEEVLRLASRIVLIDRGEIVAAGPLDEITNRLELRAYTGRLDAGSVVAVRVIGQEPGQGITRLGFTGGALTAPSIDLPLGAELNIRIRSRDVAVALAPPSGTSILNILPGRVVRMAGEDGPHVHVLLDVGVPLWARIMRKSVADLDLREGKPVYALLKAVAVDQRSVGRPTAMDTALALPSDQVG